MDDMKSLGFHLIKYCFVRFTHATAPESWIGKLPARETERKRVSTSLTKWSPPVSTVSLSKRSGKIWNNPIKEGRRNHTGGFFNVAPCVKHRKVQPRQDQCRLCKNPPSDFSSDATSAILSGAGPPIGHWPHPCNWFFSYFFKCASISWLHDSVYWQKIYCDWQKGYGP